MGKSASAFPLHIQASLLSAFAQNIGATGYKDATAVSSAKFNHPLQTERCLAKPDGVSRFGRSLHHMIVDFQL